MYLLSNALKELRIASRVAAALIFCSFGSNASEVIAWGDDRDGQLEVPAGLSNVVAIAAGMHSSVAVTASGEVVTWTSNELCPTEVPVDASNVVSIALGEYHDVALTSDGRVVAWGYNFNDLGETNVPVGLNDAVAIASGYWHNLAVTADGRVVSWGSMTNVPGGLSNVVAVAAGSSHSMALTAGGRVVAWGSDYGAGATTVPEGASNVIAIAAGAYHNLALTTEGRVLAWGSNEDGFGTWCGQAIVPDGLSNVVAIAAGRLHGAALTSGGRVVTWGNTLGGRLAPPNGLSNVLAIAAGMVHDLAIQGSAPSGAPPVIMGSRFIVGAADQPLRYRMVVQNGATAYGASGLPPGVAVDPETGMITGTPIKAGRFSVMLLATNAVGSAACPVTFVVNGWPTIESSGLARAGLGCSFRYAVVAYNLPDSFSALGLPPGLSLDERSGVISGAAQECGDFEVSLVASNRHGVGTGTMTIRVSPVVGWGGDGISGACEVPAGVKDVVAVAAGLQHSLALTSGGKIAAWGRNSRGETDVPSRATNVVAVAAGGVYNLLLTAEGQLASWGTNSYSGAVKVPDGLSNVVAIAAGGVEYFDRDSGHFVALSADGRVTAWGDCATNVPMSLNAVAIAAGNTHSLALTRDGRVWAWGANDDGYGNWCGQAIVPAGLSNVVAIAAGGRHSLALTDQGRVVAWGDDTWGQASVPRGLSNVVGIAAGGEHSMALTADGRVTAWGYNFFGQRDVPEGLSNVVAIAAGGSHSLALVREPNLPMPRLELRQREKGMTLEAFGIPGISCQLLRAPDLSGHWLPAQPVLFTNAMQQVQTLDTFQPAQFFRLLRN